MARRAHFTDKRQYKAKFWLYTPRLHQVKGKNYVMTISGGVHSVCVLSITDKLSLSTKGHLSAYICQLTYQTIQAFVAINFVHDYRDRKYRGGVSFFDETRPYNF